MRLALLGGDEAWKMFLRDLSAEHELIVVYEAGEQELPLNALLPAVERSEQWEALLVRDDIDVVLVASPRQLAMMSDGLDPQVRRVDQLKKLAQAGCSLLVSHPAADLLDAYEIEMLRRDGGGCIVPWFPELNHPAWDALAQQCHVETAAAPSPAVHVGWERAVPRIGREEVFAALARDLILIERLVGRTKRVTALGGPREVEEARQSSHHWQSFSMQLETAEGTLVRWSIPVPGTDLSCKVTVRGGEAQCELRAPLDSAQPWQLFGSFGNSVQQISGTEPLGTLCKFERVRNSDVDRQTAWLEACRSLETLSAIEKSLHRGRTVELSQSEQTEEHAFKGVMASAGCLLLMMILAAIFVVALVEGLRLPLRNAAVWRLWPLALVVPLATFLGLQFLQAFIKPPDNRNQT